MPHFGDVMTAKQRVYAAYSPLRPEEETDLAYGTLPVHDVLCDKSSLRSKVSSLWKACDKIQESPLQRSSFAAVVVPT